MCSKLNWKLISLKILAINRAEKEKIISVSLQIHQTARNRFFMWMKSQYNSKNLFHYDFNFQIEQHDKT